MTDMLPVVQTAGDLCVLDEHGELIALRDATDHVLLRAYSRVREAGDEVNAAKRALAHELRDRYGVGTSHAGGHRFVVKEGQSWPDRRTEEALDLLTRRGSISGADKDRAMPWRRRPDAVQLKALLGRLIIRDPEAHRILADACTVSPPRLEDVRPDAVDGSASSQGITPPVTFGWPGSSSS